MPAATSATPETRTLRRHRWIPVVVVATLAVALTGCAKDATRSSAATSTAVEPATSTPITDLESRMRDAGIQVVPDVTSAFVGGAYTQWQITTMQHGVDSRQGLLGAELDAAMPLPAGAPPLSYFVGAWIDRAASPGAHLATEIIGSQDWTHAPDVTFPDAVLALFVHDALDGAAKTPADGSQPVQLASFNVGQSAAQTDDIPKCTQIQAFFEKTMDALFNAIKLDPEFAGKTGIGRAIGGFLAGLYNFAVDFAKGIIGGLINAITQPIVQAISFAVSALAIVVELASFLKGWKSSVTVAQGSVPFVTGTLPGQGDNGTFRLKVTSLLDEWPDLLKDCAKAVGVDLPSGIKPGTKVSWKKVDSTGAAYSEIDSELEGKIDSDRAAGLAFHAIGQDAEVKKNGRTFRGPRRIEAHVNVDAVAEIRKIADQQIAALQASLLGTLAKIPGVQQIADAVIQPVRNLLDGLTSGLGMVGLRATGEATIQWSEGEPKKPTTTTTPDYNVFCSAWADYELSWGTGHTQTIDEHFAMARTLPPLAPPPISREVSDIITAILPSPGVDNSDESGASLQQTQADILNVLRWMKANCSTPSLHGWQLEPILAAFEAKFGNG